MKKRGALVLVLLLALLLTACGGNTPEKEGDTSVPHQQEEKPADDPPVREEDKTVLVERLAVELVAQWQDADRLLTCLDDMEKLLQTAVARQGYEVEEVSVTINTAGGMTADALAQGGVDLAFLPGEDYLACREAVVPVLTSDEEICGTVAAASSRLDGDLCAALEEILLETGEGAEFLETYAPGVKMVPADSEKLQALQERAQEETHGA